MYNYIIFVNLLREFDFLSVTLLLIIILTISTKFEQHGYLFLLVFSRILMGKHHYCERWKCVLDSVMYMFYSCTYIHICNILCIHMYVTYQSSQLRLNETTVSNFRLHITCVTWCMNSMPHFCTIHFLSALRLKYRYVACAVDVIFDTISWSMCSFNIYRIYVTTADENINNKKSL